MASRAEPQPWAIGIDRSALTDAQTCTYAHVHAPRARTHMHTGAAVGILGIKLHPPKQPSPSCAGQCRAVQGNAVRGIA